VPYPNEHAARVVEPMPQNAAIYARKNIAPGIDIILQKSRGEENAPMKVQAYRFSKSKFTAEEAKAWLKEHSIRYVSFEPASMFSQQSREEVVKRVSQELAHSIIQ
jgi:hypothetical protein